MGRWREIIFRYDETVIVQLPRIFAEITSSPCSRYYAKGNLDTCECKFLSGEIIAQLCMFILQYLRSVQPLLDDENYGKMRQMAKEFENGIAVKLQRYLILKSW